MKIDFKKTKHKIKIIAFISLAFFLLSIICIGIVFGLNKIQNIYVFFKRFNSTILILIISIGLISFAGTLFGFLFLKLNKNVEDCHYVRRLGLLDFGIVYIFYKVKIIKFIQTKK